MNLKNYNIVKKLNGGNQSKCYLLEDGRVLKIFNTPYHVSEIERYKYFLKNVNESFVFPSEFIFDNQKLYGYIYEYVKGLPLEENFKSSDLVGLSKNSKVLEKNIDYLSDAEITIYDFHGTNIIYDGNKYTVIDPDEYGIYTPQNILCSSQDGFYSSKLFVRNKNRDAHRSIICKLFVSNLMHLKYTKLILEKIDKYRELTMFPNEIIMEVKNELDKIFLDDIKTLDELNKYSR